jgi:iron complex outermembrane recepter protein
MKKTLLSLFFILFLIITAAGQVRNLTGIVSSADDGQPLPGVTVQVKGTTMGTVTDLEGKFKLSGVDPQSILVFSFVGFEPIELTVGDKLFFEIKMNVSAAQLDEVVVTALGITRQERELGYSTEIIDVDVVTRSNTANVISSITGRAAGVMVSNNDGVEGGSTRITIRGNNNIEGSNQPLIIIDGVQMENTPGLTDIGRGVDWGSPIADINALDIADYNILKGGAASARYGSRGGNGVILITTKRGQKQKGIGVDYSFSAKIIQPYRYREVQNTYGHGGPISLTPPTFPDDTLGGETVLGYPGIYGTSSLVINQDGETSSTAEEFGYYGSAVSWGPKMEGQMVKWWDGEMRSYSPQPDNLKEPFQNGLTMTHNIAASGGGDRGTMRVSITRQDHTPIIDNSNYDRTTINLAGNLKVSDKVRTDLSMTYVKYNRLNSPTLGEDASSFSKGYLYSWPRSYQGIDKEHYALADGTQNPLDGYPFLYVNKTLWWDYYNHNTNLDRDKYYGGITLTYDITPWLSLMGRGTMDFTLDRYETKYKPTDFIGKQGGYYSSSLSRDYGDNYDVIVTGYKDKIFDSRFDVTFTAGASRWNKNYYMVSGNSGDEWYYPNMYTFFNYTDNTYTTLEVDDTTYTVLQGAGDQLSKMKAGENIMNRRTNSVFGFINLSYDNYLFLEVNGRNDWSSTLPPENNSYFYPSASVSFVASEAFHLQDKLPWLNFMKIRGGAAQSATDMDPYQTEFYYNTSLFGAQQSSYFPDTIPPINLKPQRVNAYECGINLGFFENRIDFDFTYYYIYSFDQIITAPLPASSGSPNIKINEGILTNNGIEFSINAIPYQTKNFIFRTGLNFARNRNYVKSLGDYADTYLLADIWGLNGPAMILHEGDEYGTISGYDYVYHENGKPMLNEDGTKYLITDTRVPIGNASPDFIAGWNTEFTYKGFRLNTSIDTKWGGDIYCGSYVISLQTGQSPETLLEREGGGLPYTDPDGNTSNIGVILDGVYEDGTPNDKVVHYYYKYLPNAGGWGHFISTPGIIENTWVKMREISLSYTFPQALLGKSKVFQNLTLSVTGWDLFYIYTTLPDNINPEGIMGSGNAQGFEWASYPGTRSFTFGINVSF